MSRGDEKTLYDGRAGFDGSNPRGYTSLSLFDRLHRRERRRLAWMMTLSGGATHARLSDSFACACGASFKSAASVGRHVQKWNVKADLRARALRPSALSDRRNH